MTTRDAVEIAEITGVTPPSPGENLAEWALNALVYTQARAHKEGWGAFYGDAAYAFQDWFSTNFSVCAR